MRIVNGILTFVAFGLGSPFLVLMLINHWTPITFAVPDGDHTRQYAAANGRICIADVWTTGPHRLELPIALEGCTESNSTGVGTVSSAYNPDTPDRKPYFVVD